MKSARIVDFCGKSIIFVDFEICGSWISCEFWRGFQIVPFSTFGSWVLNQIWIIDLSSASLVVIVNELIQIQIIAFIFTGLPLTFNTSVSGCGCGVGFEKNIGGSTDLVKKRNGSVDLHTPISLHCSRDFTRGDTHINRS